MSNQRSGGRQQGRGSSSRGGDQNKLPWGNAFAVIDRDDDGGRGEQKADWLALGPVWESEKGALSFRLQVEPIAWRSPNFPRRVVIVPRDDS